LCILLHAGIWQLRYQLFLHIELTFMKSQLRYSASTIALILLVLVLLLLESCTTKTALGKNCREMVVVNHQLWVLTSAGKIGVYDTDGNQQRLPLVESVKAQHLAVDGDNVVAQIGPTIQRWNSEAATWETIGELSRNAFGLVVNSQHQVFAITSLGVLNVATGHSNMPASSPNEMRHLTGFDRPAAYFLDSQDNLWIGFGYGEWGGNIFSYDTRKGKFVDLKFNKFVIELRPIKSFFQFKTDVGVSSGLQHMFNSGTIARFQNMSAQMLYDTEADVDTTAKNKRENWFNQLYIGPATYEGQADYLYFYSNRGIFKGKATANLTKLSNWQLLFTPKLHWRGGQPDAVGSPMNVLKILSLGNGKLALLTQDDGIGIWDGNKFKLLP
jgi:hypothetical protein